MRKQSIRTENEYILPIHDCYGTHPNNMGILSDIVRNEFINLYCDKNFIENIHNKFMTDLKDYKINIINIDDKKYVKIKSKNYELPEIPVVGDLDIKNLNGKYIIS